MFETIRVSNGVALHLDRHLARLRAGADVLGIELAWSDAAIAEAIAAILAASAPGDAAVRVTLSRGPASRGVLPTGKSRPTLLITTAPLPQPPAAARVVIARSTRRNEASPLSRIKSLNYLDSIIARREAAMLGADDAILLDSRGRIAEATAANVFALRDDAIDTPPVSDGALPGIFRARLIEAGLARERTLLPRDLLEARSVFLGNSLGTRVLAALETRTFEPANAELDAILRRSP